MTFQDVLRSRVNVRRQLTSRRTGSYEINNLTVDERFKRKEIQKSSLHFATRSLKMHRNRTTPLVNSIDLYRCVTARRQIAVFRQGTKGKEG